MVAINLTFLAKVGLANQGIDLAIAIFFLLSFILVVMALWKFPNSSLLTLQSIG